LTQLEPDRGEFLRHRPFFEPLKTNQSMIIERRSPPTSKTQLSLPLKVEALALDQHPWGEPAGLENKAIKKTSTGRSAPPSPIGKWPHALANHLLINLSGSKRGGGKKTLRGPSGCCCGDKPLGGEMIVERATDVRGGKARRLRRRLTGKMRSLSWS
jgi:hypothetical protein